MARRELRGQLDDHPSGRQVHVQQVGRVRGRQSLAADASRICCGLR
jgi:hypothetical protein